MVCLNDKYNKVIYLFGEFKIFLRKKHVWMSKLKLGYFKKIFQIIKIVQFENH